VNRRDSESADLSRPVPSPESKVQDRAVLSAFGLAVLLLFAGCFSLDSFLFDATRLKGADYFDPVDMDSAWHVRWVIPDSLVEPETLLSTGGNRVYGFFVRAESGGAPTVIYSHGNGQNINRYWGRVELLWEAGCNVFIYDYQGYGKSEGAPSGRGCYDDAEAALACVRARPDVDTSRLVYYGWSLGSYMACHLAADVDRPMAVILENPLASTDALAKEGAVLSIPGSFLVHADFDNERRIRVVGAPVLLVYGKLDDTAVPERHAFVLIDRASGFTDLEVHAVEAGGHDNLPEVMGYDGYRGLIEGFLSGPR